MANRQAVEVLSNARGRLILQQMFWASLILSLPIVEDDTLVPKTACTDGRRICYHPEFVLNESLGVVMFMLAHEAAHVMLMHATRQQERKRGRWNIACDHAINLMLKACGFEIWKSCYCDPRFAGMSAEQIYDILEGEADKGGGDDECEGGFGKDLVTRPMSPEEVREIEQTIKGKVAQAATQAKMAGQLPAGVALAVDGLLNPPQRWQDIFRSYMRQSAADTESWTHRNRRYHHVVLPGRWNLKMGELVVIADTSGSMMCDQVMGQIGVELQGIADQIKPTRTRIIWADDAECSSQQVFEYGEKIVIEPQGGGGTDMRRPLKYVERYNPLVTLLITDTYTPWPASTPYPLVVASTTEHKAPIGRTVHLPNPNRRSA